MVSTVFVNIALFCSTDDISTQTVSIDCEPANNGAASDTIYELNSACTNCIQGVVASHTSYYDFQRQLWERGEQVPSVKKPIDSDFQAVIQEFIACTSTHCKACVAQNLSQKTLITSTLSCAAFNDVKNSISQQLMTSVTQKLTNNQDMLAPLAEMLGASSTNSIVYNITNRISSKITDNVISNIRQQISNNQAITINNGSGSSSQTGLSQESAFHSVQTYLEKTNIFNTILDSAQWTLLENLANEQNTIGGLGNTIVKSVKYLSKLLTNVVGKVVLFVLLMVGIIFVGILLYVVTNLIRKELKKVHDHDIMEKEKADELPAFDSF